MPDGLRDLTTFSDLVEGEELALPESWRAFAVGDLPIDRTPTCARCRFFAWHSFQRGLVRGRDGRTHHPACDDAHVRFDCRGCGTILGRCHCSRPMAVMLGLCRNCGAR
jgi:hypothetical protein